MRLMNKHNTKPQQDKACCFFTYYKCFLWPSLSLYLYFFTSYLITNNPQDTTIVSNLNTNVAYSSFSKTINTTTTHNTLGVLKNLKVFIYELPSKYNIDWVSNERCKTHLFASEVVIHTALLKSDVRTFDPYEADFFFVPVYVSCNFSTINGFPAIGHARALITSAVELVSTIYPFWNRTRGFDHVFVASHDFGACFNTLEDNAIDDGIPGILKNSIVLQTFGVEHEHPCQDVENVVIPPFVSPEKILSMLEISPVNGRRDIWTYFRGKMEVHPKNINGQFYSKQVRTEIWKKFNRDRRFYLRRHRFSDYQMEIARSVCCLCPLGWAPWSPRLVESVALGCVPVIIADGIRLPFSSVVKWSEISVLVAEKDVGKLDKILEHVVATNLSVIQKKLWDPNTRRALFFNNEVHEGDATWQILFSLSQKLDRSYRRSVVSSQLKSNIGGTRIEIHENHP